MIFDLLFAVLRPVIAFVLGLLPAVNLPDMSGMVANAAPVFAFLGWANQYLPLDVLLLLIGIRFSIMGALYAVWFGQWVLTKVHIFGSN